MAAFDVILSLNSKVGPGGFASVQAAGQMLVGLGRKAAESLKGLEKFSQVYRRLTIDIAAGDAATKGLIDTMDLMVGANKFVAAGMNLTAQQFKDVTVLATHHAKLLGKDVTTAFNQLTDSISKGQSRALKEYGIDLVNSEDQLLAQAEAMQRVSEQARGLTVEIDDVGQALFALDNNMGTTNALLFDWISGSSSGGGLIGDVIAGWSEFNAAIMETKGGVLDYMATLQGMGTLLENIGLKILQTAGIFGDFSSQIVANKRKMAVELAGATGAAMVRDTKRKKAAPPRAAPPRAAPRGGGKRKEAKRTDSSLDEVDFLTDRDLFTEPSTDLAGLGFQNTDILADDAFLSATNDLLDTRGEILRAQYEESRAAQMEALETSQIIADYADSDVDMRRRMWEFDIANEERRREWEEERRNWWAESQDIRLTEFEEILGIEQEAMNQSRRIWQSGLQAKEQMMASFLGSIAKLQHLGGKKAFKIGQTAAYAENIVTTILNAQKSYQAFANIPYIGPALGAAAAAVATTAGAVAGNKIRTAKYGGGGGGGGMSLSFGGGGMPSMPGGPSSGSSSGGATEVNVNLTGGIEGFLEATIEENDKRGRHGERQI